MVNGAKVPESYFVGFLGLGERDEVVIILRGS